MRDSICRNGRRLRRAACIGAGVFCVPLLFGNQADLLLPEEFSSPVPLKLHPDSERRAEATARFLQALFEEETQGPDRALDTKCKVLQLDPGFGELALDVAHQYLRRGETSEAISVLKDVVKASPSCSEAMVSLAGIYLRQLQKPELAEKYALQALAVAPMESAPYQILFEIYKAGGKSQKIDDLFARAAKKNPPSAVFWLDLADLCLRNATSGGKDTDRVVDMLGRAQEFAGDKPEELARVGDGFVLCNRLDRAVALYQLALALRPGMPGVRDKLAACLIQTGHPTEAAALLEEMLKDNSLDYRVYDQLADLYFQAHEPTKALAHLKQALLVAPPDPRRYSALVNLCLGLGDPETAISYAGEAEKLFPTMVEFSFFKALALSAARRHEEALKTFERILVEAGNSSPSILNGDFYFNYGISAEQAGHFTKAAEALRKSIELDPQNAARACNYLGYMWADRNENLVEAESLIQRAVSIEPDNGAYLDSLGWVYFRLGHYDKALAELLRAAELLKEDDPVVFEHIGDAYEKLGKTAEAVLYWQKAVRLDPDNKGLISKLDAISARIVQKPAPAREVPEH